MDVAEQIESKVAAAFEPLHLELLNESHMHSGPATDSHFKLVVVSSQFDSLNAVKRHQAVYRLLQEELSGSVHALALHLYSPGEWQEMASDAPVSPQCRGGSKII